MNRFPFARIEHPMTRPALRIRHYVGTIVVACSVGGLLLAFELAFLFQSLERRALDQQRSSSGVAEVVALRGDVEDWLRETREGLGNPEVLDRCGDGLEALLVRIEKLSDSPETSLAAEDFERLRVELEDTLKGAKLLRARPGTQYFEEQRGYVLANLEGPLLRIAEAFQRASALLDQRFQDSTGELESDRDRIWRTVGLSALAYSLLVLGLWRWVSARLLRPLQSLTREARRSLTAEGPFQLRPNGPHEVQLLTESLSILVANLVGARAHLEDKVKERTLELERANRAKNEFLANMSHEIRTPMTAILGYAELCLALDIPETDRRRYAEIIHANGEHLLSVINDILDVSKIEAGRMAVDLTPCSPFEVVSEMRALMEVRARERGLELRIEHEGPIPEVIRTDATRLRQILLNLLNNAIKFTDSGSVVLLFRMEESEGREILAFEVRDTGVGMSSDQVERIFHPFVQADSSTTRKYGGSGLGLTISKTLALLLGGDLTCESEPGQGSMFRVTIDPGALDGVRRLEHFPEESLAGREALPLVGPGPDLRGTVLLAEDVAVNRRLISTILLRAGIRVEEAENGRVAVEKAMAAREAGQPFDIIFMDMQMPEMDGYEATRTLRRTGYLRPIVALTSHSMSGERQRCLDAGCDEYMTKPIDRLVLLQVLSRFLPSEMAEQHLAA